MSREQLLWPERWIDEASTWYYTHQLTDELGVALSFTGVLTLTATWYAPTTPSQLIILDWDDKDVKNANGGTLSPSGKFELRLQAADTLILDSQRAMERRRLLLVWTYAAGAKTRRHEVDLMIRNLAKVP